MSLLTFKPEQHGDCPISPPPVEVFIETGTSEGKTLLNAAEVYGECHSIECHFPTYLKAAQLFLHNPKVKVYYGSSPQVLPWLIDPKKSTLFWLDAHYMPTPDTLEAHCDEFGQCPLLAELDAIMAAPWEAPFFVLIDDAFLYSDEYWNAPVILNNGLEYTLLNNVAGLRGGMRREEWPTLEQIQKKLPKHKLVRVNNVLAGVQ